MDDQTCTYRIADNVSHRQCDFLMIAKDTCISGSATIPLPESVAMRLAVAIVPGVLLRCLDEGPAIRIVLFTLDDEVQVVRHEAVPQSWQSAFDRPHAVFGTSTVSTTCLVTNTGRRPSTTKVKEYAYVPRYEKDGHRGGYGCGMPWRGHGACRSETSA